MKFHKTGAEVYVPDGKTVEEAIKRTTVMGISAHQDIEFMALDGILKCFGSDKEWFTGVVVTNGAGSARSGIYADYTDEDMQKIRKLEQKKAAFVGEYAAQVLLDYSSSEVKSAQDHNAIEDLKELIKTAQPKVIYTHNVADKHDTHVATVLKVLHAIRELPQEMRPRKLYGCEVWRDLDWLDDEKKVVFNLSEHENLGSSLAGVFDSQICGGVRLIGEVKLTNHLNLTAAYGSYKLNDSSYSDDTLTKGTIELSMNF
ncbi:MAG TPA: PIG-L family deacetylase [Bacillota bacterium]|nr:PIG-L family deacetylase [Bacillota bacterium]